MTCFQPVGKKKYERRNRKIIIEIVFSGMQKSKLETISHYAVILIALLAFVLSILQTRIQHRHNKLTVRPILNTTIDQVDSTLAVYIVNRGVGPALIKDVKFTYEGKSYDNSEEMLHKSGLVKLRKGGYTIGSSTVISANEKRLLVVLKGTDLKGVHTKLTYESIYEEEYKLDFEF